MKIGVIVNPRAGQARDPALPERLRRVMAASPAGAPDGRVVATADRGALRAAIAGFCADGVGLIATCGGDGSTMAVLTEAVRAWTGRPLPALALLRGGSVNTIARNLGVRGRPEALLARLLARAGPDLPVRRLGTLHVRAREDGQGGHGEGGHGEGGHGDGGEVTERRGFLFATAMGARFVDTYVRSPRQGVPAAALLMARTIGSTMVPGGGPLARRLFAESDISLYVDGEPARRGRFRMLVASTIPDVGLGMRVAWRAGADEERFHLVGTGLSITGMFLQLHRVLRGRPLVVALAPHVDRLARGVALRFPELEPFTLDGDLFQAREIDILAGPSVAIACP